MNDAEQRRMRTAFAAHWVVWHRDHVVEGSADIDEGALVYAWQGWHDSVDMTMPIDEFRNERAMFMAKLADEHGMEADDVARYDHGPSRPISWNKN